VHWFIIWSSFIAPSWSEYCLFSYPGSTVLPQVVNFSRSVEKCWCHSCQGFCEFNRCSSCLTIFLFWNQLSYFKDHVYSKSSLLKWNQRCPFLKRPFENQAFFQRSNTRYLKYTVLWLSCILKTEMTHCKFKMTFFMVLYVNFNLWSCVYLFTVCNEVTFCEFQGKQKAQVKTWGFIKKDCFFFLAPILSAYIITSSLIHEATTLMKKLFKFWDCHLSVQIAYLIKKGF